MLELALTPYDVLRLRMATGRTSRELLDQYIIIEQEPGEPFPRLYLTMIDDGRASCVFVSDQGCTVYEHRPAACRAYPLGRAVMRDASGTNQEHFVLIRENHCQGFQEAVEQDVERYSREQELPIYNRFNDKMLAILQHDAIRKGFIPSSKQIDLFILALYDIDTFRAMVLNDQIETVALTKTEKECLKSDEEMLLFAFNWVSQQLFAPL